jgi:peptide/nickel transport system substrate-binding protein
LLPITVRRWVSILLAGASLSACSQRPDSGPVVVSAIGERPRLADAARTVLDTPSRLLADSTAQGLVRFDAAGQIEPGLAERWIVIDGGMSYIFRLREAEWANGTPVTATDVVAVLRRQLAPGTRNPLAPFLTAVDEIVEMTPQVIEVRLKRPRPDLLKLFAQPELAIMRLRPPGGSGPFRVVGGSRAPLLRPAFDPGAADPDDTRETKPEDDVRLIGERASLAILRFAQHRSDFVAGGTFADWPLVALGGIAPANIRTDPAAGLFGFAVGRSGFLADLPNRAAIAAVIDRTAVAAAVLTDREMTDRILPEQLDSAAPPAIPPWSLLTQEQRLADARTRVAAWNQTVRLRIALPPGPGATLLYAQVAASLIQAGIEPVRVDAAADADLRLIDVVAPYDSARWYLATACAPCGDIPQQLLAAARDAPNLPERSRQIAAADVALAEDAAFVPIARPMRWSLVAMRLSQWRPNSRAWHPLNRLRGNPN